MTEFLSVLLHVLASPFKTRARPEAEIVMLLDGGEPGIRAAEHICDLV